MEKPETHPDYKDHLDAFKDLYVQKFGPDREKSNHFQTEWRKVWRDVVAEMLDVVWQKLERNKASIRKETIKKNMAAKFGIKQVIQGSPPQLNSREVLERPIPGPKDHKSSSEVLEARNLTIQQRKHQKNNISPQDKYKKEEDDRKREESRRIREFTRKNEEAKKKEDERKQSDMRKYEEYRKQKEDKKREKRREQEERKREKRREQQEERRKQDEERKRVEGRKQEEKRKIEEERKKNEDRKILQRQREEKRRQEEREKRELDTIRKLEEEQISRIKKHEEDLVRKERERLRHEERDRKAKEIEEWVGKKKEQEEQERQQRMAKEAREMARKRDVERELDILRKEEEERTRRLVEARLRRKNAPPKVDLPPIPDVYPPYRHFDSSYSSGATASTFSSNSSSTTYDQQRLLQRQLHQTQKALYTPIAPSPPRISLAPAEVLDVHKIARDTDGFNTIRLIKHIKDVLKGKYFEDTEKVYNDIFLKVSEIHVQNAMNMT